MQTASPCLPLAAYPANLPPPLTCPALPLCLTACWPCLPPACRLMAAVDEYQRRTRQSVFVEYVMLGPDVNCTEEHAHQLGALLRGRDVLVNLIPWNPILSPDIR